MKKRKEVISPEFQGQVQEIYTYLKKETPTSAKRFLNDLEYRMELIRTHPKAFRAYESKRMANKKKEYRYTWALKSWRIFYKVPKGMLIFLGVLHKSRSQRKIESLRTKDYDKKK
jgi:plasmid stabilization system protein ParE